MGPGYDSSYEPPQDEPELDELLCEYADGTMDPAVRAVFEEWLAQDPDLAAHAERLCRTRGLLCRYGCSCRAPYGLQRRLHGRLADEVAAALRWTRTAERLRMGTAFASAASAMLLVGVLLGAAFASASPEGSVQGRVGAAGAPAAAPAHEMVWTSGSQAGFTLRTHRPPLARRALLDSAGVEPVEGWRRMALRP